MIKVISWCNESAGDAAPRKEEMASQRARWKCDAMGMGCEISSGPSGEGGRDLHDLGPHFWHRSQ
jgi:hypothetical protein